MQITLRGCILGKYPSIKDFASAAGIDRRRASKIVNGQARPTADEMETIARIAGVEDQDTFMSLFFPELYHKVVFQQRRGQ